MADPTRPRTGPRGPHADYGPSILGTTSCCVEGLPSVVDEIVPLHMRGRDPIFSTGPGKIHNSGRTSSPRRTPRRQRRRFFSPPGGRSEREDSIRPCEETGRNNRTAKGSGPSVTQYHTVGPTLKMCPSSSTPYSGDGVEVWDRVRNCPKQRETSPRHTM